MSRSSFLSFVAVVALASGCGDDESGGQTQVDSGPIKLGFLLSDATEAKCAFLVRCTWIPSKDLCSQAVSKDRNLIQLVQDAENDIVGYDASAARTWVDVAKGQACDATVATKKVVSDAFDKVFIGRAVSGEACLVDGQCTDDLECNLSMCAPDVACCAGLCEAVTPLPVGSTCDGAVPCADGSLCLLDEVTGMLACTARGGSGAMCPGLGTCQDGLACDANNTNTCYKLAAPGEPCNPLLAAPCLDYTTWCSTEEETCVQLPDVGEACGTNNQRCPIYSTCVGGICTLREYVGAPCQDDGACILDLFCSDGQCFPAIQPVACGPIGQ